MKRSEMIDKMISKIEDITLGGIPWDEHLETSKDEVVGMLLDYMVKELGMQPPVGRCVLVPDPLRPGYFKHGDTKREWDDEEESST